MSVPILRSLAIAAAVLGASHLQGPPSRAKARRDPQFAVHDTVLAQLSAVSDLALDPDGSLYLSDFRFPAVLQLEANGTLRRTIGRAGAGPGEFRSVLKLGVCRDSLWVVDPSQVRVTLFPRAGRGVSTIPFGAYARTVRGSNWPQSRLGVPVALLPDGGILVQENIPVSNDPADGLSRTLLLRTDRALGVRDTLARLPKPHSVMVFVYDDGESHYIQPFSDDAMYAVSSDGGVLVTVSRGASTQPEEHEFQVAIRRDGARSLFRTISYQPDPLPSRVVDSAVRALATPRDYEGPPLPITADSIRRRLFRPAFYPPVEQVGVGRDGTVWLKIRFGDDRPPAGMAEWLMLSPRGFPMARVAIPASFRLLEVDGEKLYGVEGDPADVPSLVRYVVDRL
jgi:hypothetical protein